MKSRSASWANCPRWMGKVAGGRDEKPVSFVGDAAQPITPISSLIVRSSSPSASLLSPSGRYELLFVYPLPKPPSTSKGVPSGSAALVGAVVDSLSVGRDQRTRVAPPALSLRWVYLRNLYENSIKV